MDLTIVSLFFEVSFLVAMSAICSGLNVAIMSLSVSDLSRKAKLGNVHAKRVLPLRRNYHLTLASILLVNVAVISANSLVLERHMEGIFAGAISTLLIVVIGEIIPQALFTKNALRFSSRFALFLRGMIAFTYPIAKPLQMLLDKIFGYSESVLHSRNELRLMIGEHVGSSKSELDEDEIEIMRHAILMSEKHVRDIMTPIASVYRLTPDKVIDAQKIDEIKEQGYSRVPVFNKRLTQCHGVVMMKDMVDIDFDEEPCRTDELPMHDAVTVGSGMALDTLFRRFQNAKSHMIAVERDDKIVGVVTIEDLIEEILGIEIRDETDRATKRK